MAKTRNQTGSITIKKEEEDVKPTLLLNGVSNTRTSSRIAKRRPSIINNRRLPAQQVKVEEDTDTKSLLKSTPNSSKLPKGQTFSQKQINQLIDYIVNHNMSVFRASRKVNISYTSARNYYKLYKNDPEKKIPVPRNQHTHPRKHYTQEQIGNLIRYITQDKMTVREASAKANIPYQSAHRYYNKYLDDPNHNIPIPHLHQIYTQDQINQLIGYIINDKMSIQAASRKAKINISTGRSYYYKYFKQQNSDIATPSHIVAHKRCTQEQIKELISYIFDDEMSIRAASKKVNMNPSTAAKHYRQYVKENNIEHSVTKNIYTQDQRNELIGYIVDDKMSVLAASRKAKINQNSSYRFYHKYFEGSKA
jgi:DNA-binding transcriptional regulator YhcF (GntR family)